MLKFHGKTALITGSGTGIGQAIAQKFAQNGASVIIMGRRKEPLVQTKEILDKIIQEKQSGATATIFDGVDVGDAGAVNGMFDAILHKDITLDYLINNAGVSGPVTCFPNAPMDDFAGTVKIHLTGTFWTSVQGLRVMKQDSKIITISTFFTEERPLEQRPYRFRTPYTAAQGAKNRLAEAMSWELVDKGIISIATNPGPVHSDRIYKTVYPKAASEFMRVSGFEDLTPQQVDSASKQILPLLGEDASVIKDGIAKTAQMLCKETGKDAPGLEKTLGGLLEKIGNIAEKIQNNTSHMIANREFLSQSQVAESVLNLCDDNIARIINGKVIPGDRVFYPVKSHVGTSVPAVHQVDYTGKSVILTVTPTDEDDAKRAEYIAQYVEKNGGKPACFVSKDAPQHLQDYISQKVHSHVIDLRNPSEVSRWLNTARTNLGDILGLVHLTGKVPEISKLTDLSRDQWDGLVEKFITIPATVTQQALEQFVPGGGKDPRLYQNSKGAIMIVGPDLPVGKKISGIKRAQVEVFRGALRPYTTTLNQELSDVLKSRIRLFTILPGSVGGSAPINLRINHAFNFLVSSRGPSSSEVIFCVDETR